ncbi:hypothetical protein [Patulibacter minatonensis]|uniref:hypothetical protein n=1 Tax=Patulibacter minatonensis TaxID=298163 RepID=UPI0004790642|nr:hypothetical protein [Patulibacter minatonensis]
MTSSEVGPCELEVGTEVLRLHSRVIDAFSSRSDWSMRIHVDHVVFAARAPDRKGRVQVRMGRLDEKGEMRLGSERLKLDLDPQEWERFEAFVAVVKRVQAAGPEPW